MKNETYTLPAFHVWAIVQAGNKAAGQVLILDRPKLEKTISAEKAHSFYGDGEMLAAVRPLPGNPAWGYCTFECGGRL